MEYDACIYASGASCFSPSFSGTAIRRAVGRVSDRTGSGSGWKFKNSVCRVVFEDRIRDSEHHPCPTPSGKIEIFSKRLSDLN